MHVPQVAGPILMNSYCVASLNQLIERARILVGKIPRSLPQDYDTLAQTCRQRINTAVAQIQQLLQDPRFQLDQYQSDRLRSLRRIVAELDVLETVAIAALHRAHEDDHRLNAVLETIRQEIKYPLVRPVVSGLSQQYFCIHPELNLLCVPLTEGQFLLHLPDLYHELGHPLLTVGNDPVVEPFQRAYLDALTEILTYIDSEKTKERRRRGPDHPRFLLNQWESTWIRFWLTEFFCDLFAVCVVGPAFAWAHLHLFAKRGSDAYDIPITGVSTHPADAARMLALLEALCLTGFQKEAHEIESRWTCLLKYAGAREEPEFARCYPRQLMRVIAVKALAGSRAIGVRVAEPSTRGIVHETLNLAWSTFWKNPNDFASWEHKAAEDLLQTVTPGRAAHQGQ